jgi:chorismate synthase
MSNSFGQFFRITTFGESHGKAIGVVIDGCPPGIAFDVSECQQELTRRAPGQNRWVSPRKEADEPVILSGIFNGKTLGTPIAICIYNQDARSQDYQPLQQILRPSHGDWAFWKKYGIPPLPGGGRLSARETVGRVAAGALAKKILQELAQIEILAYVQQISQVKAQVDPYAVTLKDIEAHPLRCPDPTAAEQMLQCIEKAREEGDSLGGHIVGIAKNVPAGLGAPVFDKLDADLAKAILSIPAVKGVAFGAGFAGATWKGSEHNDPLSYDEQGNIYSISNHAGGINGGISNGQALLLQAIFKPTSSIRKSQSSVNLQGDNVTLEIKGRHDPCVLPRAVPIVESMIALVLVDHFLQQRALMGHWPM